MLIIDIDGTILDNKHRLVYNENGTLDFNEFYNPDLMNKDTLMFENVKLVFNALAKEKHVLLLTGRMEKSRKSTIISLIKNGINLSSIKDIIMRKDDDLRSSCDFKCECLKNIMSQQSDGEHYAMVDDEQSYFNKYEALGVKCYEPELFWNLCYNNLDLLRC